jgi:hypothetical protein
LRGLSLAFYFNQVVSAGPGCAQPGKRMTVRRMFRTPVVFSIPGVRIAGQKRWEMGLAQERGAALYRSGRM